MKKAPHWRAAKHLGKFEQPTAEHSFWTKIGDMPVAMQAKLLRVLEEAKSSALAADKPSK